MSAGEGPVLCARGVGVSIGSAELLREVDLEVHPGEVVGLIGPNGAGKSTLLAAMSGDLRPARGTVELLGKPYREYSARAAARVRAVMLQDSAVSFAHLVRDVVAMGRSAWAADPDGDDALIDRCLTEVDVAHLEEREVTTLSGGERARVALARVLAQTARCVLLDEPTAALDIAHAERTMRTVRRIAAEGAGVLVVLHDLGTAARYCDRLALLARGEVVAVGTPGEVCTSEILSRVYGWPIAVSEHRGVGDGVGDSVGVDGAGGADSGAGSGAAPSPDDVPVLWIRPRDAR